MTVIGVGDAQHLFELVADEQDRAPLGAQLAHQRQQFLDLRRRQHGRRLVEDQHVGAAIEKAQNFENLTHLHRRVGDATAPVDT